jgi:hypothetical protein
MQTGILPEAGARKDLMDSNAAIALATPVLESTFLRHRKLYQQIVQARIFSPTF